MGDEVVLVQPAGEMDVWHVTHLGFEPLALRTVADDHEGRVQAACGCDQMLVALVVDEPPDADHEWLPVPLPKRRTSLRADRLEAVTLHVDAERDDADLRRIAYEGRRGLDQSLT